ncbi:hypothetical protein ACHAWC_005721, partial [Mediolabrus comicus]
MVLLLLPAIICMLRASSTYASSTSTIHQSHIFHVEPIEVVTSVLSHVHHNHRRRHDGSIMDVDVSSTKLDDDAAVSIVQGILNTHDANNDDGDIDETVLNLKLEMNRITPVGISNMFDLLVGAKESNKNEETQNAAMTTEDDDGGDNLVTDNNNETTSSTTIPSEDIETDNTTNSDNNGENVDIALNKQSSLRIDKLDLSFNDCGGEGANPPSAQLLNSVRRLFENEEYSAIPRIILMENCGIGAAFCRSIGRGILNAYERNRILSEDKTRCLYRPSVLRIGGNPAIGDAGAVAIAAAFRMATSDDNTDGSALIMEELDLSSCNIGDVGAEAIALALACNPSSLKKLDLSNNKITDVGVIALARALLESRERTSGVALEQIILDNNVGIGDDGAAALAKAVSAGVVSSVHIRSCSICAEGAAAFGKAVKEMAKQIGTQQFCSTQVDIDMSGNHFGISKPKKKKGSVYSASFLRDKASSNIKFIGRSLQSRLKGSGFGLGLTTAESDDDEEDFGNIVGEDLSDDEEDVEEIDSDRINVIARCGARSFSGEILDPSCDDATQVNDSMMLQISIGMRQCFLDNGAIDSLAAAILSMRKVGAFMSVDVNMNSDVDDLTRAALRGDNKEEVLLSSCSERYMNEVKRVLDAEERRQAAAEVAAARMF